ncbi:MAG: TIGR01777 family protein [Bacteroidetes bacterium]|nr:MAG: TIGR01777 family protein [Bacteroidota bacterium]
MTNATPTGKTVLITGGTGLVGQTLCPILLQAGYGVIILTRRLPDSNRKPALPGLSYALWNPDLKTIDEKAFANANIVVHLAGAGVMDQPWTQAYKAEIKNSRVESAALLVRSLASLPHSVETVISASAIGWYGADAGGGPFVETDPAAPGFLGETCQQWEAAISPVTSTGQRLAIFRTGIVLSTAGGAMAEFLKPLRFRLATILGSGTQMVSWIHATDLANMMLYTIENPAVNGIYNAVAPQPVTNKQLNLALGKTLYGNAFVALPAPTFILKLMLGQRSVEILKSANVSAQKIESAGFKFQFPAITAALKNLLKKP